MTHPSLPVIVLVVATAAAGCSVRAASQSPRERTSSQHATSVAVSAEMPPPSAAQMDTGGEGEDVGGATSAGVELEAEEPRMPADTGGEPEIVWTRGDRDALVHYDEWMQRYEARLGALSEGVDCGTACSLVGQICELAARICDIAERHPEDPSLEERCHDGRRRCTRAHQDVSRQCRCER